ncbi:MAG: UDP-N-acetylmuramoyl-tripeptide--D-alanyl-D-alanine ligase [Enterocloster asparagiformis]|nr:UDP-N-acetylmuramoyl-tripeptide--D-alanyl-D-alanine ligase [Enterocloster asparagiformis]
MENIRVKQIVEAANGRLLCGNEDQAVANISLDSRNMAGLDLFVPIVGEKVDAHRFICQAIGNGAVAVFTGAHRELSQVEKTIADWENGGNDGTLARKAAWIAVEDTRAALQALGAYCRGRLNIPIVGITGSVGKTTTREMIAAALSAGYAVYRTPGNSNSQVGVPVTMSSIPSEAQIAVIELGISEPGEMEKIARVARVDSAVVTNIGIAHIEQLGSQENILREKLHIQDGMDPEGILFLNGDDPLLAGVRAGDGRRTVRYGMSEGCDYRAEDVRLDEGYPVFTAVHGGERTPVRLQVMGTHMVGNAMAALAVASEYGVPMDQAARTLGEFGGYKGRQQIHEFKGMTIIDDSYNASPVSMKAGLEVLSSMKPGARKIAVLADMKELGPDTVEFHREIGHYIAAHPVDQVLLFGELAGEIGAGIREKGGKSPFIQCAGLDQVEAWLQRETRQGDCILFKGSNSMKLGEAVAEFMK